MMNCIIIQNIKENEALQRVRCRQINTMVISYWGGSELLAVSHISLVSCQHGLSQVQTHLLCIWHPFDWPPAPLWQLWLNSVTRSLCLQRVLVCLLSSLDFSIAPALASARFLLLDPLINQQLLYYSQPIITHHSLFTLCIAYLILTCNLIQKRHKSSQAERAENAVIEISDYNDDWWRVYLYINYTVRSMKGFLRFLGRLLFVTLLLSSAVLKIKQPTSYTTDVTNGYNTIRGLHSGVGDILPSVNTVPPVIT